MRAKTINDEMKIAAANAIAKLAKEDVPDEVVAAMGGERPHYGKDYIIPSTFDPRLISIIPAAVAKAAIETGVSRKKIDNFDVYKDQLKQRLDPTVTIMQGINNYIKKRIKKKLFLLMEKMKIHLKLQLLLKLRAWYSYSRRKRGRKLKEQIKKIGYNENFDIEIVNSKDKIKRKICSIFI